MRLSLGFIFRWGMGEYFFRGSTHLIIPFELPPRFLEPGATHQDKTQVGIEMSLFCVRGEGRT